MQFEMDKLKEHVLEAGQGYLTLEGEAWAIEQFKGTYEEVTKVILDLGFVSESKLYWPQPYLKSESWEVKKLPVWLALLEEGELTEEDFNELEVVERDPITGKVYEVEPLFMSKHSLTVNTIWGWLDDLNVNPLLNLKDYVEVERGVNPSLGDLNWREVIYV